VPVTGTDPEILDRCLADDWYAVGGHRAQPAPRSRGCGVKAHPRQDILREARDVADTLGANREIETSEFCRTGDTNGVADGDDGGMHVVIDDRNRQSGRAARDGKRYGVTLGRADRQVNTDGSEQTRAVAAAGDDVVIGLE